MIKTIETEQMENIMNKNDERIALKVDEIARALGVSKATVWNRIRDGHIKSFKFGHLTLVPAGEVDRILSGQAAA